ncbi:MAG TPA: response regulator [Terriglobales bacterium]
MSENFAIRFLVVDDEESIRRLCITVAEGLGFTSREAADGQSALAVLEEHPAHVVLTDLVMPHMNGIEFLNRAKQSLRRTEIAVMTGHGSIETAVQAMMLGAYDYISKPFSSVEELRLLLRRMAEKVRLVEENEFLRERAAISRANSQTQPGGHTPQSLIASTHLGEIERATIQRVFQQVNGDKSVAGKLLGISRATLYRKLKRYNISPRPNRLQPGIAATPGIQ